MHCDVTPLAASSQGHRPDRENARGDPPKSGSDFTRNYLIVVFLFGVAYYFASPTRPESGGMVGGLILYYKESRNTIVGRSIKRRREWHARGSAAAGPESNSPHLP